MLPPALSTACTGWVSLLPCLPLEWRSAWVPGSACILSPLLGASCHLRTALSCHLPVLSAPFCKMGSAVLGFHHLFIPFPHCWRGSACLPPHLPVLLPLALCLHLPAWEVPITACLHLGLFCLPACPVYLHATWVGAILGLGLSFFCSSCLIYGFLTLRCIPPCPPLPTTILLPPHSLTCLPGSSSLGSCLPLLPATIDTVSDGPACLLPLCLPPPGNFLLLPSGILEVYLSWRSEFTWVSATCLPGSRRSWVLCLPGSGGSVPGKEFLPACWVGLLSCSVYSGPAHHLLFHSTLPLRCHFSWVLDSRSCLDSVLRPPLPACSRVSAWDWDSLLPPACLLPPLGISLGLGASSLTLCSLPASFLVLCLHRAFRFCYLCSCVFLLLLCATAWDFYLPGTLTTCLPLPATSATCLPVLWDLGSPHCLGISFWVHLLGLTSRHLGAPPAYCSHSGEVHLCCFLSLPPHLPAWRWGGAPVHHLTTLTSPPLPDFLLLPACTHCLCSPGFLPAFSLFSRSLRLHFLGSGFSHWVSLPHSASPAACLFACLPAWIIDSSSAWVSATITLGFSSLSVHFYSCSPGFSLPAAWVVSGLGDLPAPGVLGAWALPAYHLGPAWVTYLPWSACLLGTWVHLHPLPACS